MCSIHVSFLPCQSSKYTNIRASILSRHSGTDSWSSKGSLNASLKISTVSPGGRRCFEIRQKDKFGANLQVEFEKLEAGVAFKGLDLPE